MTTFFFRLGLAIYSSPGAAAGLCAFMVAFFLVAGNALYGQEGEHPGPLWATRDNMVTRAIAKNPERAPRRDITQLLSELPRSVPVPLQRSQAKSFDDQESALVREVQQALAAAGYYKGEIDGRYGPMTGDAVKRYQAASGLAVNGVVGAGLLAALKQSSVAALEARIEQAVGKAADERPRLASSRADGDALASASLSLADVTRAATIARIQIGLINFGESRVVVDGTLGEDTANAIRAFQKRYNLPVTGEPDETVVKKLESLGVLSRT